VRRSRKLSRFSAGYNLVVLGVAITVMTIMVAAALPSLSGAIRREKEEELIFRGLQMAEGIRVFQRRFGRLPATLDELYAAEPRALRQKWKDPMTEDGLWEVITAQEMQTSGARPPGGRPGRGPGGDPGAGAADADQDDDPDAAPEPPPTVGPDGRPVQGPVAGVRSAARGRAMKMFDGADAYRSWRFTFDLVQPGGRQRTGATLGGDPTLSANIPNADTIGRPFRPGITPGGAQLQGGNAPKPSGPGAKRPQKPAKPATGDDGNGDS
jgi:type II secretory pathway pseudopilin PulG